MNNTVTLLTGKKVMVKELQTSDEEMALQVMGSGANMQNPYTMKKFMQELMKMMIVSIDDKPTTYQTLSETPWSDLFTIKETRQLELLYQTLHSPTEAEDASFLKSIKAVSTVK